MLGFVAHVLLTGSELMQALSGTTGAEISLLPGTKASQATSEAALGRPCLLGSQRKWEITWNTEWAPPPPRPDTSGPMESSLAECGLLQSRVLIRFAFFQSVERNHLEDLCAFLSVWMGMCLCSSRPVISLLGAGGQALLRKTVQVSWLHASVLKPNNTQVLFPL